jgi:hypothetical protein
MSKNLTRKGLALGAVIALGTSLFAGAPAQATGGTISLASSFGTGTKTILGSTFQLSSTFVGATAAPGAALKYFVTGVAAADIINEQSATNADLTTPFSGSTTATDTTTPTGVTIDPVDISALGNYGHFRFALDTTRITATTTVSVTAFYDNVVTDGKITAGEIASSAVSVTFVKPSEVSSVATMSAPVVGTTTAAPKITLGDINLQQVTAGVVRAVVTRNGVAATGVNALWNKDDASLNASVTGLTTAAATDVYSARAEILDLGTGANTTGNVSSTWTANGTASALVGSSVGGFEVGVGAITAVDSTQVTGAIIRAKSTSVAFKAQVTVIPDAAANYNAPAGIPARVVVSGYADLGTTTLTIGGKTIDATATSALTVDTTTDASGLVNFTVNADKGLNGEKFKIKVQALDKTSGYVSTSATAVDNEKEFTYTTAVETKVTTDLVDNLVVNTAKGGTVSFGVAVYDQFGAPYSSTKGFKVFATSAAGSPSSGATVSTSVVLSNGKGTISYTDNSTANGSVDLTLTVKEQTTTSSGLYTAALAGGLDFSGTVAVHTVASSAVTVLTGTNTSNGSPAVEYVDFKSGDTRTGLIAPALATTAQTFAGKALAADGSAVPGALVTITAPGVQFYDGTSTYGIGSITVRTNATGDYAFSYYSQKSGKQNLVVTSGAAAKTVVSSEFAAPTYAKASKVAISGLASILPGRTSVYAVSVTDKFGNAVEDATAKVSVSYTGPGYFTSDLSAITVVSAKGTLSLTLLAGAADLGTGTLTVKSYGIDNASTSDADKKDDVVATQAIQIGAAPVVAPAATAAVSGSTGKFYVSATNAAAKKVVVKVAGKFFRSFTGTAAKKTVALKAPKGKHKVTVFVGGKLVTTKTITVK